MADTLAYHWQYIDLNDVSHDQFDGELEHRFQDVIDCQTANELKEFRIIEKVGGDAQVFCVTQSDLKFYKGTVASPHATDITPSGIGTGADRKIIFWRRNQVRVNEFGEVVKPSRTTYIMGYKVDDQAWTMDIFAAVGQLPEVITNPRETNEDPISDM